MASCTQIDKQMQAYVDGELRRSELVVFEQHVSECAVCAETLRKQQKTSALLFESLAQDRLTSSVRQDVMKRLPAQPPFNEEDIDAINWRAKHPGSLLSRLFKRTPIAVALLLLVVAALIRYYWPESPVSSPAVVGMITQSEGLSICRTEGVENPQPAKLQHLIDRGTRLETTNESRLMLSFRSATEVKVNGNTRLTVHDERNLTLEEGELYLKVGKDGRHFVVNTPNGKVRVFGTVFVVGVQRQETRVCVEEGLVQVESSSNKTDFAAVSAGQETSIMPDGRIARPRPAHLETATRWATSLQPNSAANKRFREIFPPVEDLVEIAATHIYRIPLVYENTACSIHAVRLYGRPPRGVNSPCSYDVYVYDQDMKPLFKARVEGRVLVEAGRTYYDVPVPGKPLEGLRALAVSLVPDFSTGDTETSFEVKAVVLPLNNS